MSSHHPRQTAWRSATALPELKTLFFPTTASLPDPRALAVSLTSLYSTRLPLPHSLLSTSLLTSVLLTDIPHAPTLPLRLAYSTALCRFVNGLLDPGQQSSFALPMTQLAANLGLPASFVELRHAATHEALPTLPVLRTMAQRALQWLWGNYWVHVSEAGREEEDVAALGRVRELLRGWRRIRRERPAAEVKGKEEVGVVAAVVAVCKEDGGVEVVGRALREVKALVPRGGGKKGLMKGARVLWGPFLVAVGKQVEGFTAGVVGGLVEVLAAGGEGEDEMERGWEEAFVAWVKALCVGTWDGTGEDIEEMVKVCLLSANEWTVQILAHLLKEFPALKQRYGMLAQLASEQVAEAGKSITAEKRTLEDIDAEVTAYEERLERMQQAWNQQPVSKVIVPADAPEEAVKCGKWRKWQGAWTPRPLGVE